MSTAIVPSNPLDPNLAVKGYFQDKEWMQKTGMGGVFMAAFILTALLDLQHLMYLPVAMALLGLISGFVLRTIRQRVADPQGRLPDWDNWMDLWISGITWLAVAFGWFVLSAIVVTTIVLIASAVAYRGHFLIAAECGAFAILLFAFLMRFLTAYLMVNFAVEERLGAGFSVVTVLRRVGKNPKAFLAAWILSFWIQILSVVLPLITIIGVFVIPSTYFAGELMSATILAQAWRASEEKSS